MPPEACSDHCKYNVKLDIFSYGHLALFTAAQTFPSNLPPVYDDEDSTFTLKLSGGKSTLTSYNSSLEIMALLR